MKKSTRKLPCVQVGDYERQVMALMGYDWDTAKTEDQRASVLTRAWRQLWATPQWFVDGLSVLAQVSVTLDLCAEARTAKAPWWFGPGSPLIVHAPGEMPRPALDAFEAESWRGRLTAGEAAWCNPPFALATRWVERLLWEADLGLHALMVTPASTDRPWFAALARHDRAHMTLIEGERLRFLPPPGVQASSPAGGVVVWTLGWSVPRLPPVLTLTEIRNAAQRLRQRGESG